MLFINIKHSLREIKQGKCIEFDTIKEFKKKLSQYHIDNEYLK